jgi:ParB-like chromosome segregation protein Spo0J
LATPEGSGASRPKRSAAEQSAKAKALPKGRLAWVKTVDVKIPDIRVTSVWEPEMLSMFKASIKAMGILDKPILIEEGIDLWLVDGLHRLQEAQLASDPRIQVVIFPGTLKDVYLKNLALNRLHGKTKVSEMVLVVRKLEQDFKMDMEQISAQTGLKRDYVEKMMILGRVSDEVLRDLDAERIGVGHAAELARVEDRDVQERLLKQCKQYDITVKDLHDIVDQTLKILSDRKDKPPGTAGPMPLPPSTVRCAFCDLDREVHKVKGFNVCQWCFSIALDAIGKAKAAMASVEPLPEKVQLT